MKFKLVVFVFAFDFLFGIFKVGDNKMFDELEDFFGLCRFDLIL